MIFAKSAGGIVFIRLDSKLVFLLLLYEDMKEKGKAAHWSFPKGQVEEGESAEQTVLREIKEETGLGLDKVIIVPGFKKSEQYFFRQEGNLVKKIVVYFLVQTEERRVTLSEEHLDYAWLNFEQAGKKISFKSDRQILEQAHDFLEKGQIQQSLL